MAGEGIVNFGVPFLTRPFRNTKWSSMLGFVRRTFAESLNIGGCSSLAWKVCVLLTVRSTPSKPWMKSMCHQSRRNSPSVTDGMPTSSCSATTSRMHLSCTFLSSACEILPARCCARASCNSRGRSRLPTWSARNGGFMRISLRGLLESQGFVGRFPGELRLFAPEVAVRRGLLVDRPQQVEHLDNALGTQVEVLG